MPGALVFGAATSDRADCGSDASLDDLSALTYMVWAYPTTLSGNRMFVSKMSSGAVGKWMNLDGTTTSKLGFIASRATTDANYRSVTGSVTTNAWQFLAATFDVAATPTTHLYRGTLTATAAELSYDGAQTDGSGALSSEAAEPLMVGNYPANNLAIQGRIAVAAVFGSVLTLAQMQSWQKRPRKTVGANVAKLFVRFGKGAANGIEYVIPATVTVTGATEGNGVPLWQGDESRLDVPYLRAA